MQFIPLLPVQQPYEHRAFEDFQTEFCECTFRLVALDEINFLVGNDIHLDSIPLRPGFFKKGDNHHKMMQNSIPIEMSFVNLI